LGLAELPPQLIAAGRTDPGQRRGLNEDAWRIADESELGGLIEERGQLFAVADGMGGHAAGEVASQMAIETLFAEYYGGDDAPMSPAMRLEQAILTANAQIYEQAGAKASQAGMGTTIVAAVARGEWLTIANVGDSRAYLIRDGAVQQLTHDHSWVAEQVTAGLLTEQQAQNHMYRNVVTRCLGHNPQIEVDTFEHVLEPRDLRRDALRGRNRTGRACQPLRWSRQHHRRPAQAAERRLQRGHPRRAGEPGTGQARGAGEPANLP
jgi:serine/threonine protein phosphatase PrpC